MIDIIWWEIGNPKPVKEDVRQTYKDMFDPSPGTWCVSTNPCWHKGMTKKELDNLQKESDANFKKELSEWKLIQDFLDLWSNRNIITELDWNKMIRNKALQHFYVFRYNLKVLISLDDYRLDEGLMENRMNWDDQLDL